MLRLFINSCALLLLPLLPLLLLLQQQQLRQRRARRRRIVRHIYGERRLVATGDPSLQQGRLSFQAMCVSVWTSFRKVSLHSSAAAPLYNVFTRFSSLHAFLQRTVKISLPHTNTGTCAAAATHTFTATTSSSRSSSSLVSREAIKSSTKETNTFFLRSSSLFLLLFLQKQNQWSRHTPHTFPPFAHNFDTVLTARKKTSSH